MNKFQLLDDGLMINKISKSYGNKKVVRDISISINRGEIVGLLGPNGAGKTTTFYMIVGLVKPDTGSIVLDKFKINKFYLIPLKNVRHLITKFVFLDQMIV